jgi:hypothetical protein
VAATEGSAISPDDVAEVGNQQSSQLLTTKEEANVAASRVIASQVPITVLSKKLRDAAGKKGKAKIVREIIEEAGERFPDVSF